MLTKNYETLTIEVKRHVEADAILQGKYWDGEQGCFIGCLAHSDDATIFESLPEEEARGFFAAIPDAVGRDGKDLTRVHWEFLASELRCLPEVDDDTQSAINVVIEGMDLLASGGEWSRDAAYAAYAAADAAADAAPDAARATARLRQRDTILRLISEA